MSAPPQASLDIVPHTSIEGRWSVSDGVELVISEDKEQVRTAITIRSTTLTLPKYCHVMAVQTCRGSAAIFLGSDLGRVGYEDLSLLVCKATGNDISLSYCAKQKTISKLFNTTCFISKVLSVNDNGKIQLEIAYAEKAERPTRVLRKIVWWDSQLDKEVEAFKNGN
jgi:hypothetical protein